MSPHRETADPPLLEILREWGRLGCIGFGGPPAHIALLRELCIDRRGWISEEEFEHGIAATNLLPGPASTQLAIYCAWRLRGIPGALVGGVAFIVPGLILIIALAAAFLSTSAPDWVLGVGAGAGAVVAAVAVQAGLALVPASRARVGDRAAARRWLAYLLAGLLATILIGPWLVVVLLGCGIVELLIRRPAIARVARLDALPLVLVAVAGTGGLAALCWTAFKVGALSYGGGFVIIPLMQADAVDRYGWMTDGDFLNAVALGQATPGPVVQTVAVVGYAAAGLGGAILASVIAFAPSFWFIALGAERFDRLRTNPRPRAFLDGAGPAAIGAILGSAVPLALALGEPWQWAFLAIAAGALFVLRLGVLWTLLAAGAGGAAAALLGAQLPG
ncbi:MAG: chromate efflux transporter [Solirubrobacterales bacterium]|nr:chromate efflux transporter [Solirubrobacterales bacterium]